MMKKNLFVLLLALMLPLSFVCAENYPYRSDVLWVTVAVKRQSRKPGSFMVPIGITAFPCFNVTEPEVSAFVCMCGELPVSE